MKVLHVITDTNIGGAGRYLLYLLAQPAFDGFDVTVACPDGELGKRLDTAGIRRLAISGRDVSFSPRLTAELRKLLKRERPNLVHTHGSLSGRIAARMLRIPVIYTKHGLVNAPGVRRAPSQSGSFSRFLNRTVARVLSDRIIAVSEGVRRELIESGIRPEMVVAIPNGIDLTPFRRKAARRPVPDTSPERPGLVIGTAARLSREKGLDVLLDAAKLVLASEPSARFVIGGEGPMKKELERKIRDLRLEPYVKMVGFVEDIPAFLAGLDIYVLPSNSEGIGLAVLEAMAAGLPVVATSVGGIPEAVVDGSTGILVPPGQPKLLAQAIVRLTIDRDLARSMGAAGRARAGELFDARVMAERTAAVYRDVVRLG